jgi:site-specific recombinase XerD
MSLAQAIQAFDRHMAVERNLSEQTRRSYLSDLCQYSRHIEKEHPSMAGDDAIPVDLVFSLP